MSWSWLSGDDREGRFPAHCWRPVADPAGWVDLRGGVRAGGG
ncbi:Uncharacterized protein MBO1_02809 [Mycobacterium tuberculosis variant bovis]|nr:Uncharacterized protein MBO1_02809 [Mycobacterium tuberculosis variant bovis]CEJ37886.1 Uncharacterized protein MBO_300105 [Mycobacterium tuberculosis variant bovis]